MNKLTPHDRETLDNYSGMSVGQIIKRARLDQKINIQDIATHLNISSTHLEAIEADDIQSLPPKVYAVGFVRAYSDLLGLDSEKMSYLFKVQFYDKGQIDDRKDLIRTEGKSYSLQETVLQKDNVVPLFLSFIGGGIIIIIGFIFLIAWIVIPDDKSGQITVPDVPPEMMEEAARPDELFVVSPDVEAAPAPIEPMDSLIKPDEGGAAYGGEPLASPLAFKMRAESWIEIRAVTSGKIIATKTYKTGDVYYVQEDNDILLTTGNAGGIEAFLDGQSLGLLGKEGEIIRLRPFSVEALRLKNAQ